MQKNADLLTRMREGVREQKRYIIDFSDIENQINSSEEHELNVEH